MKILYCNNQFLKGLIRNNIFQIFSCLLLLVPLSNLSKIYSQTTSRTFTIIPITDPDLNAPGRGVEQWHDYNDVNVPAEGTNTQRLDVYYRFVWTRFEAATLGSYTWAFFDGVVNNAILKRQKFSFGIMTVYPGGTTSNGLVSYGSGNSSYPLYLHNLMQAESVKDWKTGSTWTPNYNSEHYLNRLLALNQAINAHIEATSFNGVRYKDVINCIDIRGYGGWGEWHSAYTPNNLISDYPAGTFPTVATLKRIVDAHTQGFPNFPLVAMIAAFDAQWLNNTWNPPEIAYYVLTTRNTWGPIGWRRDQWAATDSYLKDYLENNNRSFGTSGPFKNFIMDRWKTSPITGEPPAWNPDNYSDLERQIRLYHATSFGNGNYGVTPTTIIKDRVRASSKACGYRLVVENATVTVADKNVTILMNWKNLGQGPTYENWNVIFELRNTSNALVWSGLSQFTPKLFLPPIAPSTAPTPVTDNFTLPGNIASGTYNLNLIIKDPNGYRGPLPLAITSRNADSSYTITPITITSGPPAPTVTVVDNCGSSVLTASSYTGSLLWSTGETTSSITVTTAGTYTVSQTISGSTSSPGNGVAAPKVIPAAPPVAVVNNCGNSVLTASGFTGSLLWSSGATSSFVTVSTAGTYTVTQTVNGCASTEGSGVAEPVVSSVAIPIVTVTDNCGSSVLTVDSPEGSLLWSTGATSSSITVNNAGTYTVTQSLNGCTSAAGSGIATPTAIPATPIVSVLNNCESSQLTVSSSPGSSLWNTGAASSSINVNNAGTYTVTQTVNGCTSPAGSGVAAPKTTPNAPTITVVNNCGSSILTASGFTGSLLWSTGATSSSITVNNAGTYTVTQTVNGCASTEGSGVAEPVVSSVAIPIVTVTDNCGSSVLTVDSPEGSLLWSTGATSSSITVNNAETYTVTQSVNGCTSAAGSGIAAPTAIPATPTVAVLNNCESSLLTVSSSPGSSLWNTGATSSSITVNNAGTYTVTQTVNGCTSPAGSGVAAPKTTPNAPTITVVNNCGSSVLSVPGSPGSLLWSTGATSTSITVTTAATYTVTQTVNGCTSTESSGLAEPIVSSVAIPIVTVTDNCGSSVLTVDSPEGSLLWSTGATSSSITVNNAGTYTVTQTVNGCTSAAGSGIAAPTAIPATPTISVLNNCESSLLTVSSSPGSSLWNTGATSSSITVNNAGTYTVTQTVNGCTSPAGSGVAAPKITPAAPTVSVTNNCGNSVLTASGFAGSLLWSNGAASASITVSTAGTYTLTQTVNGCTSQTGSGVAAPLNSSVTTPLVTVANNCGNSVLTASGFTGSLLWSNGATSSSIIVSTAGTYTVTQTVGGCSSLPGSGFAAPKTIPVSPTITVANNCGNSVLTAGSFTGSLLWSNGAATSSITVSTAATYTVTQTVNGCTSTIRSGVAAPKATPVAPTVTVVNNCGNSVLTAGSFTGSLLWSNGAATSSITVTTAGTYTVTQTVNGCTSVTRNGVAAPKAIPALSSNLAATTTSGSAFTYTATSATTGTTFAWSRAAVTGVSNAAASGTGNINETLVNTLSSIVNVTYVYTLTANGCSRTQNVIVAVNPVSTVNCVINGSITSSFNSTSIPAGRYIWFNSSFNPGSLGNGTATVTFNVTNSKVTFTANSQQYTLNVPNSRIRFDNTVTSASTQFINNVWETSVPRSYTNYVFMGGLAYLVPSNLPGNITNIRWTADIRIDKTNTSLTWRWSAATYTSFAAHSGLNIKPINSSNQNPYSNSNNAGTPENFKSSVISGAKGSGGTNYTGTYSSTSTATCTVNVGQRSSVQNATTQLSFAKQIPELSIENLSIEKLEANVIPNPSNTFFNLLIRSNNNNPVQVRVMNIFGQVVERHEKVAANTVLQIGHRWASGSYLVEVVQSDQRKIIKIIKVN